MKKRTKVLIGVAVGVVVSLAVAGALLLQPPVPYRFLEGSNYEGTVIIGEVPTGARPLALRRYWIAQPFAEVCVEAEKELTPAQGWRSATEQSSYGPVRGYTLGVVEEVSLATDPGGTIIVITRESTLADRVQVWLWRLTHRE